MLQINQAKGQCQCPDSIRTKFYTSAANAVLRHALLKNDAAVLNSLLMPQDSINKVLDAICALHNSSGNARDSVFTGTNFLLSDDFDYFDTQRFNLFGDSNNVLLKNWYKNGITGNTAADNFLTQYAVNKEIYYSDFIFAFTGSISARYLMNPLKMYDSLQQLMPGVSWGSYGNIDHSEWFYNRRNDSVFLHFQYKWGDCNSGCINKRSWYFVVTDSCKVSGPFYSNPPEVEPIKARYIYQTLNQDQNLCWDASINYPVSFKVPQLELNELLGGTYGTWYLNGNVVNEKNLVTVKNTGTYVLKHVPKHPKGIYVEDTFRIAYKPKPYNGKMFIVDTVNLCGYESFNWTNYLKLQAHAAMQSGKMYVIKPSNTTASFNYAKYRLVMGETSRTCLLYDSFWAIRLTMPSVNGLSDTQRLKLGDSVLIKPDAGWDSAHWNLGFTQTPKRELKYNYTSASNQGTYNCNVQLVSKKGCDTQIFWVLVLEAPAANHSISNSTVLKVFPNPTEGVVHISGLKNGTFALYSLQGAMLQTGEILDETFTVNQQLKGTFILALHSGQEIQRVVLFVQ
ncbi:MAG: hypothetical protein IT244_09925 [Bacteroidia bacterium]|nr:hypothetical protein [Bacteroidia bacterium]